MNISKIQKELNEALKILLEDDNEKKETTLLFGEDLSKNVSELYQKVKKVFSGETEDASIDGIKKVYQEIKDGYSELETSIDDYFSKNEKLKSYKNIWDKVKESDDIVKKIYSLNALNNKRVEVEETETEENNQQEMPNEVKDKVKNTDNDIITMKDNLSDLDKVNDTFNKLNDKIKVLKTDIEKWLSTDEGKELFTKLFDELGSDNKDKIIPNLFAYNKLAWQKNLIDSMKEAVEDYSRIMFLTLLEASELNEKSERAKRISREKLAAKHAKKAQQQQQQAQNQDNDNQDKDKQENGQEGAENAEEGVNKEKIKETLNKLKETITKVEDLLKDTGKKETKTFLDEYNTWKKECENMYGELEKNEKLKKEFDEKLKDVKDPYERMCKVYGIIYKMAEENAENTENNSENNTENEEKQENEEKA